MNDLTAIAYIIEPCQYAMAQLRAKGKEPIVGHAMCCFEDLPERLEAVSAAMTAKKEFIASLGWGDKDQVAITARMGKLLSDEVGFQVMCVPFERAERIIVHIQKKEPRDRAKEDG